jgi:hypothetical protein
VLGGPFALDGLAPDGHIVKFHRQGPLTIRDLYVNGSFPGPAKPTFLFSPPPPFSPLPYNDTPFELSNLTLYVPGSAG